MEKSLPTPLPRGRASGSPLAPRRKPFRYLGPCLVLALLVLAQCASEEIQVSFGPDNGFSRDNALSLQAEPGNQGATFRIRVRVGRESILGADDTLVEDYLMDRMVRTRFTLKFNPEIIEYSQFEAGTFLEAASGGQVPVYSVEAEVQGGQQTGRIFVEASIDQVVQGQSQGDLMFLEFTGIQEGVSNIGFENFFGEVFATQGEPLTGISFYGGRAVVLQTGS